MTPASLPLIHVGKPHFPIAVREGEIISREQFLVDVHTAASHLPDRPHVINLCFDRYHFMVAFAAALLRGQLSLLPPSRAPEVIAEVVNEYDAYCLSDRAIDGLGQAPYPLRLTPAIEGAMLPNIEAGQAAIMIFTSGSTGRAQPNRKTWGQLVTGTRLALHRFGLDTNPHYLLATVPPQHMYGLESTVLYAMLGPNAVHAGQPFYPEDLRFALTQLPMPRMLVTTPAHLRVLTRSELEWPKPDFILCATAPLDGSLAAEAEQAFGCPLHEIYGCTEAGAIASRQPVRDQCWRLYEGMHLIHQGENWLIAGPQLDQPQTLSDRIEYDDDGCFALLGRKSELLNIAGKRTTIGELNHRLLSIPGVIDGCFIQPDPTRERLAALVVAPDLDEATLLRQLARSMDPVFLPRPLIKLTALPRTDSGKLPRQALLTLIDNARLSA
ncbi:hypothetical protein BI364_16255 [Acidihalobacter yilgarnensis]|uniref:AMP-dependent synthetase/ligase domain-containing protein n=1 Tax=Acidihalobacter yilgarnensis TaxID=2819280 RepID=A0A1D8IS26_9GAMM|nr:AMP-binding protein [Acidihalobacter yilgarnensis]AOU99279.1 hypothetical protein BI364_16255 [Acidihalobacter yilgarnensis]